ncbi:MAG: oligoribonuclease [marine bacterium B5-7]|nr:MAG: oligoribonuclease [marine bacterium B5-7]
MSDVSKYLIWIDCEMTGLKPAHDCLIEIATIVTDNDLNIVAEGPTLAIHQHDDLLNGMDSWNTKHHGESGLTERVRQSTITEAEAEAQTLAFMEKYVGPQESPMCGNSIHQDRRFLVKYMPNLAAYFHYRNLDVSTLKELARRWNPAVFEGFKKESKHLALDDIKDSIEEMIYYREHFVRD